MNSIWKGEIKLKIKKLLITSLMIIPLIVTGCSKPSAEAQKPESGPEENSIAIEIAEIEKSALTNDYSTTGKLYASEEVSVSSEAKGKIASIKFKLGDKVKKGDVLYTLDNSDLKTDVNLQKSKLKTSLNNTKIRYDDELENYNKMKSLYETGVITKKDLDNAEISYQQAKLNYQQAQKDYESNSATLNSSLNDTIVKSPISGIVASRNVEIGEMTGASDFVIVKLDPIIAKANVSEDFINKIAVGDNVRTKAQDKDYVGNITSISPVGSNNGNIYPVEIEIENKDSSLKPGMFADIAFEIEKLEDQIMVPKKSILSKGNENYVYIIEENNPKKVIVEKGITKDGYVQISGELNVGDKLVVKGQEYIEEGSSINIVNEVTSKE